MDQGSGDEREVLVNVTEVNEYHVSSDENSDHQVNWITTLAPLLLIILVLIIGVTVHLVVSNKRRKPIKRGKPDPNVCMDPDPTRERDVRVRFLIE
jgi:hypothetical protein